MIRIINPPPKKKITVLIEFCQSYIHLSHIFVVTMSVMDIVFDFPLFYVQIEVPAIEEKESTEVATMVSHIYPVWTGFTSYRIYIDFNV